MKSIFAAVLAVLISASSGEPTCPDPNGEFAYAHPDICDQFYLCVNGTISLETCGNGLLFDGKGAVHNHCNYNWAVDCGDRVLDPERTEPVSSGRCEYQYGIYEASPGCSTEFVKCAEGVEEVNKCLEGLVYDARIHACNWPDLLLETCQPDQIVRFKCPADVDPNSFNGRFLPFPRFVNPSDPGSYYICNENYPRLVYCGEGVFNGETLACEEEA